MSDTAIRVESLSKRYRIGARQEQSTRLSEAIVQTVTEPIRQARHLLSRGGNESRYKSTIWALKDISFEVKRGELVGVIGPNGAGKSTLLKILARITEPTRGSADIYGRVSTLLEVGTGFHGELTGRENVYLSGSILGMRRSEIRRKFDDIVTFAGIEQFIDTPVKHYSSGMYLRLAFAVAAYLDPDILLVDEVLAVGDAEFQKRCLGVLEERRGEGKTALFVSHNTVAINSLTARTLWLDGGQLRMDGSTSDVTAAYQMNNAVNKGEIVWAEGFSNPDVSEFKLLSVRVKDAEGYIRTDFDASQPCRIEIEYRINESLPYCRVGIFISTDQDIVVFAAYDADDPDHQGPRAPGHYISQCLIPGGLFKSGPYFLSVNVGMPSIKNLARLDNIIHFVMVNSWKMSQALEPTRPGVIAPILEWEVNSL